uniref:hypothetical protein n=1 Tax=Acetatifactor sp. TaxID=1872090 RepID=UPI00405683E5
MLAAIVVISLLAILLLLNYLPVMIQYVVANNAERDFANQLSFLNENYEYYSVVITDQLGLGTSQNSDVKFEKAHKNQAVAVDSILSLIDNLH